MDKRPERKKSVPRRSFSKHKADAERRKRREEKRAAEQNAYCAARAALSRLMQKDKHVQRAFAG